MNSNWTRPLLSVFALSLFPTGASAEEVRTLNTMAANSATVATKVTADISTVKEVLRKKILDIFTSAPIVAKAEWLSQSELKLVANTEESKRRTREATFLVRLRDQRILGESIFVISEEDIECKVATCMPSVTFKINGPIHSYETVHPALKKNSESLNNSFTLTLGATAMTPDKGYKTAVGFQMDINDRSYMGFLRQLHESRRIEKLPIERDIKGAFLLWGSEAISKALQD